MFNAGLNTSQATKLVPPISHARFSFFIWKKQSQYCLLLSYIDRCIPIDTLKRWIWAHLVLFIKTIDWFKQLTTDQLAFIGLLRISKSGPFI